ncbi:hypothetical protein BGW39_000070 [Mortierella sp. 14UC]|nr:hypothetical protein BGW39_000070 [Mortierella sp. 14UC]
MSTTLPPITVYSSKPTAFRFIECTIESRHLEALFLIGNDSCDVFMRQLIARIPNHKHTPDVSRSTNLKVQYNSDDRNGITFAPPSLANSTAQVPLFSALSPLNKKLAHPLRVQSTTPWHRLGHHYYRTETQVVNMGKTSIRLQYRYLTVPQSQITRDFNDRSQDAQFSQLAPEDEPERQFATSVATLAFIEWSQPNEHGHRSLTSAPCPFQDRSLVVEQTAIFFRPEGLAKRASASVRPDHAFKVDLPLRPSDVDQLGHVTNSRYALLLHDVLSHGLEKGYYANGSGPLKTTSTLPVYSGKASSTNALTNIPAGSKYYKNAEILEFYVGYESELKVEDTIVVWSWVERERIVDSKDDARRPIDVMSASNTRAACANCLVLLAGEAPYYIPNKAIPPSTPLSNTIYGAAALDNRPTNKWPIHFILGDAPTLNPVDTTKVQVCKKCHDLFDKGNGLQGDPKDLIPRAPRLSMFSRIPRDMQDLTLEQRRALRLAGCPTPAKAKGKTVEALLFPWLYPLGTGMYADGTKGANCRSFQDDMEIKLRSADSRWRDDDEWATWAGLKAEGKDGTADLFKPL